MVLGWGTAFVRSLLGKKRIASFLGIILSASLLTGCQYSSLDEYLELLGMKDPYQDEVAVAASTDGSLLLTENSTVSPEESTTAESADSSGADSSFNWDEYGSLKGEEAPEETNTDNSAGEDNQFFSSYKQLTESELNDEMKAARENAGISEESLTKLKETQSGDPVRTLCL